MSVETVRAYVVRRPSGERKNRESGARVSAVPVGAPGRDVSAEADPRPASAAAPTGTAPHTAGLALVPPVKAVPPPDVAVSGSRIGVIVATSRPDAGMRTPRWRTVLTRLKSPAVRTHVGSAVGVLILAVLLWRLGTGVFLDGLRRIDGGSL
ncbi:MAG: UPF0104 family protein, partial [Streptomyces sp.]|nr:UPF0104 family protein [Streptomyces sp.]